jgi:hypothetical protein
MSLKNKPICLWAVPRSTSTALMYAFRQLKHTTVVDEPLYGHYLRVTGTKKHPISETALQKLNLNGQQAMHDLTYGTCDCSILFIKNMCHHLIDLELDFLADLTNVFLIREPAESILSLTKIIDKPILRDTGFDKQIAIFNAVCEMGQIPPVIDRSELLKNPEHVLRQLCEKLNIPFNISMLQWKSGPKQEDNPGQDNWYHAVRKSIGFQPYQPYAISVPENLKPLVATCQPLYEKMFFHAILAMTKKK